MSHLAPYRLNVPNLSNELSSSVSNPKKRRKNVQTPIQTPPNVQDLLPPPLSGYGDTIVASNPFDDCPNTVHSMNSVRSGPPMGVGPGMNMGLHMTMCRPIGSQMNINSSSMMHSPNTHQNSPMISNMMMNGPRMNSSIGNQMGSHMMNTSNGPIHPIAGPMHSPMGSGMPTSMSGVGNGPMNVSVGSPMAGPGSMNGPMSNGPMNGPMHGGMNGPMSGNMNMNVSNGPIGPPMNNNFMMSPMSNMYPKPMPPSAGKVYPADQPMVFNSQNPNAPPIYPCGVCHKEVHDNDQAILCESGCNFWFHRGCTGLTEAAFQLLTAEVYAEWVCDKCLSSKNIPLVKFKP
ncbi:protein pygopus [Agrilus planipennis]|uniref:Protein pygopus n=1 Tax=Agrilus planipennis TaxID=224129 RepID=A0A1W4XFK9_AGRPL|nr:protein pygopus [Agrilus planipennis]